MDQMAREIETKWRLQCLIETKQGQLKILQKRLRELKKRYLASVERIGKLAAAPEQGEMEK